MDGPRDTDQTAVDDPAGALDPLAAAALLQQTKRQARRQFENYTPLVLLISAAIVLGAYGSIWLSVRGQHPYQGPSLGVIGLVYTLVLVAAIPTSVAFRRATAGVSGPSRREKQISAIPLVVAYAAVYVFMGALQYDGFSHAVVYGVFDAAAPWMVVGAALAAGAAARSEWRKLAAAIGIVVIGTASAFAGPIDVWGVLAVAGCVGLVAATVVQTILLRRA
jgi:hypothetical protein